MNNEVRVRVMTIGEEQVAFVDFIDSENNKFKTLNNKGEWQDALLYSKPPTETMLQVTVSK